MTSSTEFLVTAQAYAKDDEYKQTILLHDTFMVNDKNCAKQEFESKYQNEFNILKIFSITNLALEGTA